MRKTDYLVSDAVLSPCGTYRYLLRRGWSDEKPLGVVMLNPSTADAAADDNTIRRCAAFARSFGHGGVLVANLFAYRATRPGDLALAADPVGPDNFRYVGMLLEQVDYVLCAWGANGALLGQGRTMGEFLAARTKMYCLGTNRDGSPKHPLYVRSSMQLMPYALPACQSG